MSILTETTDVRCARLDSVTLLHPNLAEGAAQIHGDLLDVFLRGPRLELEDVAFDDLWQRGFGRQGEGFVFAGKGGFDLADLLLGYMQGGSLEVDPFLFAAHVILGVIGLSPSLQTCHFRLQNGVILASPFFAPEKFRVQNRVQKNKKGLAKSRK